MSIIHISSIKDSSNVNLYIIITSITTIIFLLYNQQINTSLFIEAQVVSHELRKLAISTNQFGIDALKALDRIEPPDRVIVFCPVCLSSSLMMIMMGSSKYQVVSSFRQALYVWTMKPNEINRAFKDIFDHIGLNNQQQLTTGESSLIIKQDKINNNQLTSTDSTKTNKRAKKQLKKRSLNFDNYDSFNSEDGNYINERYLSLPKLIKIKEFLDNRNNKISSYPWWYSINNGSNSRQLSSLSSSSSKRKSTIKYNDKLDLRETTNYDYRISGNELPISNQTIKNSLEMNGRDLMNIDSSQMNSISNIYIQRGLNINYNYNLLLRQYYKTVIHPVDFFRNGEETRQHINSLVASNTEGKIKDLVKKKTFENVTQPKIMIISTFHFRGTLDVQIKNANQQQQEEENVNVHKQDDINSLKTNSSDKSLKPNQRRRGREINQQEQQQLFIETEKSLLKYGLFSNLDCSVIEIPFNNRLVSLIIVMPNNFNSTELLITKLSAQILSDMINSLIVKRISIEIPVIKFDRGPINVNGLLKELGLSNFFFGDKIQQTTETGFNKWMKPSDIVHETSIDIGTINPKFIQTEDRLKVGAHSVDNEQLSTINNTNTTSDSNGRQIRRKRQSKILSQISSEHIKLDKPFLYFVFDSLNSLVLTMGRIRQ